jgi:hypothetical protein
VFSGLPLLNASNEMRRVSSRKRGTANTDGAMATFTTFYFPIGEDNDPATQAHVRVLNPVTGAVEYTAPLSSLVGGSPPAGRVILVTISFQGSSGPGVPVSVTVTVEGWSPNPVSPV